MYSVRFLVEKFPNMDRQKVAEEFEDIEDPQQKRTVIESVRINVFDDCLGRKIAAACPNEE